MRARKHTVHPNVRVARKQAKAVRRSRRQRVGRDWRLS
jgi:ribosomal protein S21